MDSRFVEADRIRTHYLEAGDKDAPAVVLVHGGEFGACAELAWEHTVEPLAREFHVLALDMIGYGQTDKIVEFGPHVRHGRRIRHLAAFVEALGLKDVSFVGNSLGGSTLTQDACAEAPMLSMRRLVSISGHPATNPEARQVLQAFDGTAEAMKGLVAMLFHDPKWTEPAHVARKLQAALIPGAYEAAIAVRARLPGAPSPVRAAGDPPAYERIRCPTLIVIGAYDRTCADWGPEAAARIPLGELRVFRNSGHCAHLEEPEAFNEALLGFLRR